MDGLPSDDSVKYEAMDKQTQVVIIGAGPTGLSLATQLLRYGIDCVILEKNEQTTHLSKAVVVQARTLEIFQELNLAEKAIQEGRVTTALNLFYKGRQKAAINLSGIGEGLSPYPFALSLEQSKTEKILFDHLTAREKQVNWKFEFTHMVQNETDVLTYYRDNLGQEQMIRSDYLVGCDGAGSLVRHQLGLTFEGDTLPKVFYVADVKIKSPVINKSEVFMFMIKKGFILFFPMEGLGHYRIVGILPEADGADEKIRFTDIEKNIIDDVMVPLDFEEIVWFSSYKVHSRRADIFSKGRCFIAGDAAHIHTPAGGQGMNTGIQDGYNLAWKIACTIKGQVNNDVLKTYNIERVGNAKHLLQTTDRMFDLMAGTSPFWNFIRLNFFPALMGLISKSGVAKKKVFPLLSQIGISYDDSSLTIDSSIGKINAGIRMPHFILADGSGIFDHLAEPAFKLLFFGHDENNREFVHPDCKLEICRKNFSDIPPHLFGQEKDFYILLRPDNHISYIGKDRNVCDRFIDSIINR